MTLSEHNPFDDQDGLSDAQLDHLLGSAAPRFDRRRLKRLRRDVRRILKTHRSGRWTTTENWMYFLSHPQMIACVVAASLLLTAGYLWFDRDADSASEPSRIAQVPPIREPGMSAPLVSSPTINSTPPLIISRKASLRTRNENRKSVDRLSKSAKIKFDRWLKQLENQCLQFGSSDIGLAVISDARQHFEQTLADSKASRSRRSSSNRSAQENLNHRDIRRELKQLARCRRTLEAYLLAKLHHPEQAASAFRILCRIGTQNSLPTILNAWDRRELRADILVAVNRLGDSRMLGRLAIATQDRALQSEIMSQLLCRRDPGSVDLYLEITARYEIYAIAQASGQLAHCLPSRLLIQRLRSKRIAIARAAAITLSHIDDPGITEQLIQLAQRQETCQVAMMALTARNDPSSQNFVRQAANDWRWSATVQTARKKWNRLLAIN